MTINLQDIASIVTIVAMGFCIASCVRILYKARKADKLVNKLLDDIQQEHIKFMDNMGIKLVKKTKLSIVENKDKECHDNRRD
jgi:hypothetical protein